MSNIVVNVQLADLLLKDNVRTAKMKSREVSCSFNIQKIDRHRISLILDEKSILIGDKNSVKSLIRSNVVMMHTHTPGSKFEPPSAQDLINLIRSFFYKIPFSIIVHHHSSRKFNIWVYSLNRKFYELILENYTDLAKPERRRYLSEGVIKNETTGKGPFIDFDRQFGQGKKESKMYNSNRVWKMIFERISSTRINRYINKLNSGQYCIDKFIEMLDSVIGDKIGFEVVYIPWEEIGKRKNYKYINILINNFIETFPDMKK